MRVWIQNQYDNLPCEGYRKQRFWLMCEAFADAGHEVVFWTSDFSHAKKERRDVIGMAGNADRRFDVRLIPTLPYMKNVSLARVRSHKAYAEEWFRQAATNPPPDIIISSVPSISAAETALKLARQFGAKFVLDVQDAWPETFERLAPVGFRWLARLLLTPLRRRARRLYRAADVVTGVCERYRALTDRPDYYRAYLGIDLAPGLRDAATRDDSSVRLVYAGNMGTSYDLKTVVAGMKLLRGEGLDVTLDVAGFGSTGDWGMAVDGVRFRGMLSQSALQELMETCDIGVIPMNADSWVGIPNKLSDYARAGLTVVSSLTGETEALLKKYDCGATYRVGDATSFATAVRTARVLPRGNARKMVEAELDAARIYREYVAHVIAVV